MRICIWMISNAIIHAYEHSWAREVVIVKKLNDVIVTCFSICIISNIYRWQYFVCNCFRPSEMKFVKFYCMVRIGRISFRMTMFMIDMIWWHPPPYLYHEMLAYVEVTTNWKCRTDDRYRKWKNYRSTLHVCETCFGVIIIWCKNINKHTDN